MIKGRGLLATDPVGKLTHDTAATPITTAAWVQITATFPAACTALEIFDSSGRILKLSTGSVGNEDASELLFFVFPGGSCLFPVQIKKDVRLSARAVDANATVGRLNINIFGGKSKE